MEGHEYHDPADLAHWLNEEGLQGWELTGVVNVVANEAVGETQHLVFKREA